MCDGGIILALVGEWLWRSTLSGAVLKSGAIQDGVMIKFLSRLFRDEEIRPTKISFAAAAVNPSSMEACWKWPLFRQRKAYPRVPELPWMCTGKLMTTLHRRQDSRSC